VLIILRLGDKQTGNKKEPIWPKYPHFDFICCGIRKMGQKGEIRKSGYRGMDNNRITSFKIRGFSFFSLKLKKITMNPFFLNLIFLGILKIWVLLLTRSAETSERELYKETSTHLTNIKHFKWDFNARNPT